MNPMQMMMQMAGGNREPVLGDQTLTGAKFGKDGSSDQRGSLPSNQGACHNVLGPDGVSGGAERRKR